MGILVIDNKTKLLYIERYVGKIYKILPMYEEDGVLPNIYIHGLLIDINSANELFDGVLIEILVKLHSLYKSDFKHKQIKKIVLECTNLLATIKDGLVI